MTAPWLKAGDGHFCGELGHHHTLCRRHAVRLRFLLLLPAAWFGGCFLVWGSLVWLIATPTRDRSWSNPSQKWGCGMHDFLAYFGDYKICLEPRTASCGWPSKFVGWHGSNRQPTTIPKSWFLLVTIPAWWVHWVYHITFDRPPKTNGIMDFLGGCGRFQSIWG